MEKALEMWHLELPEMKAEVVVVALLRVPICSLRTMTKEIQLLKPVGQSLGQPLARHKTSLRAKSLAEENVRQASCAPKRPWNSTKKFLEVDANQGHC